MIRRRLVVRGVVQGVGYRLSCRRQAERLGVTGWVCNRSDGTVEIVAEGPRDAVDAITVWARRGPAGADVTAVETAEEPVAGVRGFDVRG